MRKALLLSLAVAPGGLLFAQPQPQLQRVGQGIGDIGPSAVDTRIPPADLRQPLGFEGVYRVGARDPLSGFDARPLVRISGATLAVFPRSAYMHTRAGMVPQIPAGTIFYLGQLPDAMMRPASPTSPSLLSLPLDSHALEANYAADYTQQTQPEQPAPLLTGDMFSSEEFRRGRVARLLALPPRP